MQFESLAAPAEFALWLDSVWTLKVSQPTSVFGLPDYSGHFVASVGLSVHVAFEPPKYFGSVEMLYPETIYFGFKIQPGIANKHLEIASNAKSILNALTCVDELDLKTITKHTRDNLSEIFDFYLEPNNHHHQLRTYCESLHSSSATTLQSSERQFRRVARSLAGTNPKTLARTIRIRKAIQSMGSGASKIDVANQHGFADQAHFTRECVIFTGYSPGKLLSLFPGSF